MNRQTKSRWNFSHDALSSAFSHMLGSFNAPIDHSRRNFLQQSAGALAASALPHTAATALLLPATKANSIEAAAEAFVQQLLGMNKLLLIPIHGNSSIMVQTQEMHDVWREILRSTPPIDAEKAEQMIAAALPTELAQKHRDNPCIHYLIDHPDDLKSVAQRVTSDARLPGPSSLFNFEEWLEIILKHCATHEQLIESNTRDKTYYQTNFNRIFYRRYGRMLAGTSAEDAQDVKRSIQADLDKDAKENRWQRLDQSLSAQKYAQDYDEQGNSMPTYLIKIESSEESSVQEVSRHHHYLVASVMFDYPSELMLWDEHETCIAHAGKLTLTPVDQGLLVTFPAGWQDTQLQLMQHYLLTLSLQRQEPSIER